METCAGLALISCNEDLRQRSMVVSKSEGLETCAVKTVKLDVSVAAKFWRTHDEGNSTKECRCAAEIG
jgi:hypothetical protein